MDQTWAMQIHHFGSPEVLKKTTIPRRPPGPTEVAIAIKACGVNFADILMRMGLYPEAPRRPFAPGYEVAGIVEAVGSEVTHFKPGDRVMAATYFNGYANYICAEVEKTLPLPENMSFEEGAGILVNYMTAWVALQEMSRIRPGDNILVQNIAGGVGMAALQLAKNAGCTVFGTAGSKEKLDFAASMGMDYGINYRTQDYVKQIQLNHGRRVIDVVLDPIGGQNLAKGRQILRPTGRLVVFGSSEMVRGDKANPIQTVKTALSMFHVNLMSLFGKNQGIYALNVLKLWRYNDIMQGVAQKFLEQFAQQRLTCIMAQTFPLEQAAEAHRYLQERKNIGKVVLTVS